jgi:hypothetical protein
VIFYICLKLDYSSFVCPTTVYQFAARCLEPKKKKYLLWHTEDCFGLRGRELQAGLQKNISGLCSSCLNAGKSEKKITITLLADILGYSSVREIESVFPTNRRLQYGKYMSSTMNITINVRCADTAEPKALGFFGYRSTEEMYIGLR